jgi:methionyl-tRNA formyltransferase
MNKPRIAFFGTPDLAVWVLEALKEKGIVPDLIITAPDAPKGRKLVMMPPPVKVWALAHKIPTLSPTMIRIGSFEESLRSFGDWDLFIVAAYGKIIPENILYLPKRKTINVHPSLLPLLRGPSPIQTAILEDMKDTGVTIIRLDKEVDHGPILAQKRSSLSDWPLDQDTLGKHLAHEGGIMIAELLPSILSGQAKETEQDHTKATFTKMIEKSDGKIDLSAPGYTNFLKYNAFKGWPGTFFFAEKDGKRIRVSISEALYKDGAFSITKVIPEGKKEMTFAEFERYLRS